MGWDIVGWHRTLLHMHICKWPGRYMALTSVTYTWLNIMGPSQPCLSFEDFNKTTSVVWARALARSMRFERTFGIAGRGMITLWTIWIDRNKEIFNQGQCFHDLTNGVNELNILT